MEQLILNITNVEKESILVALKQAAPTNTNEKDNAIHEFSRLGLQQHITLNNQESLFTKNALKGLVKMFLDLDACNDSIYLGAELALSRFEIPEINDAVHLLIKLCDEIEPLTLDELLLLIEVISQYSAAAKRFISNGQFDGLKPEYKESMTVLLVGLDNAKHDLNNIISGEGNNDIGAYAFSLSSIKAVLSIIKPIIYNPEIITIRDEEIVGLLSSASKKIELLSGLKIDKVENIDFSQFYKKKP